MNSSKKVLLCLVFTMAAMIQSTNGASFKEVDFVLETKYLVNDPGAFNKILKISDHTIVLCTREGTLAGKAIFYIVPRTGNQIAKGNQIRKYDEATMKKTLTVEGVEVIKNCGVSNSIFQGFGLFSGTRAYYINSAGEQDAATTVFSDVQTNSFSAHSFDNGHKVIGFGNLGSDNRALLFSGFEIGQTPPTQAYLTAGAGKGIVTLDSIRSNVLGESSTFYLASDLGKIHKIKETAADAEGTAVQVVGSGRLGALGQSSLIPHDVLVGMISEDETPRLALISKNLDKPVISITAGGNHPVLQGQIEAIPTFQGFFAITRSAAGVDGDDPDLTANSSIFFIDAVNRDEPLVDDVSSRISVGGEPILALRFIAYNRILIAGHKLGNGASFYQEIVFTTPFETQCHVTCGKCKKVGAGHCLTCILNYSKSTPDGEPGTCIQDVIKDMSCRGTEVNACAECSQVPAKTCKKCLLNYGLNTKSSEGGTSCTKCSDPNCLNCDGGDACEQCIVGYKYNSQTKECVGGGISGGFLVSSFLLGIGIMIQLLRGF